MWVGPSLVAAFQKRIDDYWEEGVKAPFELIEDGIIYFRALMGPETALLRKLKDMTAKGFEFFCGKVLEKLNSKAVVDGGPNDGGVDFYALDLSFGPLFDPAPPSSRAVVLGQAKRFTTKDVGESAIRSFVGGSIKKADDLRRRHPDRFGLLTPVLLAFWTTSDFSSSAKNYSKELGLWYLSGLGFSQLAIRLGLNEEDVDAADFEANKNGGSQK